MEELDLKYLQYALAVVRYGSVTQAARALYLAQPNLSRAIGELEQSLGFPLFLRTRQGMSLTPQGERFLTEAETLLDRMPVGLCLLRRRPDGGVELLRANQVLSRLLGLSPAALARRLAEDPGSGLPTGEREELLAAAVRSRECGLPLRRACRVCLGGGRELCLSLHMSWVEQPDGSWLAYIACADISQEAAAQA